MSLRKLYRPSWAAWLALVLHVVVIVAFLYILWIGPSGRSVVFADGVVVHLPACPICDGKADAIKQAAQMGRLDLVSMSLAILGVGLALAAFGSYFIIRNAAMEAAREEAKEQTARLLPAHITVELIARVLRERPEVLISALAAAKRSEPDVTDDDANKIAAAQGDGDESSSKNS